MKNFFKDLGKGGKVALVAIGILVIMGATVFATGEIIQSRYGGNDESANKSVVLEKAEPTQNNEQEAEANTDGTPTENVGQNTEGDGQTVDTNQPQENRKPKPSQRISLDGAVSIALGQVDGATANDVVKAKKDRDDGRLIYEIEIIYGNYEYEFEITPSGKIIEKDIDRLELDDDDDYDDDDDDDDDDWD